MVELGKCRGEVSHRPIVRPTPGQCRSAGGTVTCVAPVVAVDIGGTKIALALVDEAGDLLAEQVVATAAAPDPEEVWAPLAAALTRLPLHPGERYDVGIGTAGPIDTPAGTVSPVNIPGWRDFPLVARVAEAVRSATGTPGEVVLAGDGHCIALGEHWLGAGRGLHTMVGMVISTGIGGGAVVDDQLFTGSTGNAVHVGHTSVNAWGERCVCGCHGCVEMYARGPALVAAARARGWSGTDGEQLTASAGAGDPVALAAIDHGMRAAAAGIAATATQLDIDTFVIGGGLSKAGEVIFGPLRRHLADFAALPYLRDLELRPAELPNAGLLGAASLALSVTGRGPLRSRP